MLTKEGVPAPDAGRTRTDNGVEHVTSGVWHATTITNIARNPLLVAIVAYGRRSMGDQRRMTANGHRVLTEEDFRSDGKPKVIRNKAEEITQTPARFDPLVKPLEREQLIELLDRRGGSQRGKPRSRDPNKNPLGARVFDMKCGWPMYRVPKGSSFAYTCGAYMQWRQCEHNRVDGPTATQFVMSCLRQKLAAPHLRERLQNRLKDLAAEERLASIEPDVMSAKRTELAKVQADLEKVGTNMALAENPQQYRKVASVFDGLRERELKLEQELAAAVEPKRKDYDPEAEVIAAMAALERLPDLVLNDECLAKIGEAFRIVNVRLFLNFQKMPVQNRLLNKLVSGVVTFGEAPPPVPLYAGPTGRRAMIANKAAAVAADSGEHPSLPNSFVPGGEVNSLGNVNRGDWI
jgi:hypothetical protein